MQESMELQVSQIGGPDEGRKIINNAIIDLSALGFCDLGCLYPFRTMVRTFFFVEEKSFDAIRVSLQSNRPVFEVRKQNGRNSDVVINDVSFRKPSLRIENFIEVRDVDLRSINVEALLVRLLLFLLPNNFLLFFLFS